MAPAPRAEPARTRPGNPEHCLYEVWEHLTAQGFAVDEPLNRVCCQCFFHDLASGASCEMDLLRTGALVWTYMPPQDGFGSGQAARLVLGLLTGAARPRPGKLPEPSPALPLKDAAGLILAGCGMTVRPVVICYSSTEVSAQTMITNPAARERGHVRVSESEIRWECRFTAPGWTAPGLAPRDAGQAIAAALTAAEGQAR